MPEAIASRGYGDALVHRLELGVAFEFLLKLLTACLQELDIRDAVSLHLELQVEDIIGLDFVGVPVEELRFFLAGHAIRIVKVCFGDGSLILLVLYCVEQVREESLALLCQAKGGRERG